MKRRKALAPVVGNALVLAIACLSVGASPGAARAAENTDTTTSEVLATHPLAVLTRNAFDSGDVFKMGFHLVQGETAEEKEKFTQDGQKVLDRLQSAFAKGTPFQFVDGKEFRFPANATGPSQTVIVRMKGEDAAHPSMFRLPADGKHQVYLVFSAKSSQGQNSLIHLVMWPVGGTWKARALHVGVADIGGVDFETAFAAGQQEEQAGHTLVAWALYRIAELAAGNTAFRTSGRGLQVQPIRRAMAKRLGTPQRPIEILKTRDDTYRLVDATGLPFTEGPYLALVAHIQDIDAQDATALRARQQRVAAACLRRHPELKQYFKGIAVNAVVPAGADKGKGFRSAHLIADLEKAEAQGP